MKNIGIQAILCIIILFAPVTAKSEDNVDTITESNADIERTTEITMQTPGGLYLKMLTDDPFIQVTLGCAGLFVIAGILLIGHRLYTLDQH